MPAPLMSREEVVDRLFDTFRSHGYDDTSLSLLSKATGLGKSSLYHYFPKGKEDMARAVLERTHETMVTLVATPLLANGDPRIRLGEARAGLREFYESGEAACFVDLFSQGSARDLFAGEIAGELRAITAAFTKLVEDAGMPEAESRAERALMILQGGLIVARATGEAAAFDRALDFIAQTLLS